MRAHGILAENRVAEGGKKKINPQKYNLCKTPGDSQRSKLRGAGYISAASGLVIKRNLSHRLLLFNSSCNSREIVPSQRYRPHEPLTRFSSINL